MAWVGGVDEDKLNKKKKKKKEKKEKMEKKERRSPRSERARVCARRPPPRARPFRSLHVAFYLY